jgi:hypothetical protein
METATRSKESLWAELQQIQQAEMATLKRKRDELEQEKTTMLSRTKDTSDIVTINVGGELILRVHRDTLCLAAGSGFAALFSGRWDDHCVNKDELGHVFLDHNPDLIRIIVNHLRIKRIEDPFEPVDPPHVPDEHQQEWCCLLKYYGLTSFFTKPFSSLGVSKLTVIQPHGSNVSTQRVGKGLQLSYDEEEHYFVACTPCLVPGTMSSWKLTVNKLPTGGWLYLGLIGNAKATNYSYSDSTSLGWAGSSQVYVAGSNKQGAGGWSNFTEGECLLFGLANSMLTMFSVTKSKRFVLDGVPDGEKFIHFNFGAGGTTLTLEPLDATEYAKLVA